MHRLAILLVLAWISLLPAQPLIRLHVDASNAPRRLFHVRLAIPARPGPLTLVYPKWIPGEHGPTGPLLDLAGLKLSVDGKPVAWKRDLVEMYLFHCDVPAGATRLEADYDYLLPAPGEKFSSGASSSDRLAVISWNQVVL